MSENHPSPFSSGDSSHVAPLIEALLTQVAASSSGDDEAFLERVERAIDRESMGEAIPRPVFRPSLFWALGAAASIALALLAWASLNRLIEEKAGPLVVGAPAEPTPPLSGENPKDRGNGGRPIPEVALNYIWRGQEEVKKADEAALRGSRLMADGDYQGAIDQYRASLDLLPDAPITAPRRQAYVKQFSRASVLLANQRTEEGRYPESIALIEEVLRPQVDPDSIDAKRLLETLNDPDYYSPALTPSHLERVRRLNLALRASHGYLDLGDYDRAEREFNKVLNEDRYNVAARRGMEESERQRMNYYDAAYDHTRSKMLREVAQGWELPVPQNPDRTRYATFYDTGETNSVEFPNPSRYAPVADGSWASPLQTPLSTFSIDVDTASWTNLRGLIRLGVDRAALPKDAIRIEELVNYFPWNYPQPTGEDPFAFATETGPCPWNPGNRLIRVGIQARSIPASERPAANLVFLVDVSSCSKGSKICSRLSAAIPMPESLTTIFKVFSLDFTVAKI